MVSIGRNSDGNVIAVAGKYMKSLVETTDDDTLFSITLTYRIDTDVLNTLTNANPNFTAIAALLQPTAAQVRTASHVSAHLALMQTILELTGRLTKCEEVTLPVVVEE